MSGAFKGLKTHYKASAHTNEEFFITPCLGGFKLHVEPAYRYNGTQKYDGYFPRYYRKVSTAKGALTKFLGKPEPWVDVN